MNRGVFVALLPLVACSCGSPGRIETASSDRQKETVRPPNTTSEPAVDTKPTPPPKAVEPLPARADADKTTPKVETKTVPEPVRGVSMHDAIKLLAGALITQVDEELIELPCALLLFRDTGGRRSELESYVEARLIESMTESGFLLVPRSDEMEEVIESIRATHGGEVTVADRIEYGQLRAAQWTVEGRATKFPTFWELSLTVADLRSGTRNGIARVEVAWSPECRALDQTRLVSLREARANPTALNDENAAGLTKIQAEELSLRFAMRAARRLPNGKYVRDNDPLAENSTLKSGDRFALHFQTNRNCHVYGFLISSDGTSAVIFPRAGIELGNNVQGQTWYRIPKEGIDDWYNLDKNTGMETIYLIASDEPIAELAGIARDLARGQGNAAVNISRRIVTAGANAHRALQGKYVGLPGSKGIEQGVASIPSELWANQLDRESVSVPSSAIGIGCAVKSFSFRHD